MGYSTHCQLVLRWNPMILNIGSAPIQIVTMSTLIRFKIDEQKIAIILRGNIVDNVPHGINGRELSHI
ncbi:hypothetical protein CsatA_028947 [Cannabis sativa]